MSVYLRNISIKGIKNLCNEVEVIFSKKEVNNFSELRNYNIKAIYGANGSGKTAIVHAFQILSNMILYNSYLFGSDNTKYLFELMNKACKTIEIKLDFFHSFKEEKPEIYTYEQKLQYKNGSFEIVYEKFSKKVSEYGKEKVITEIKEGQFLKHSFESILENKFMNLLKKRSFADILFELYVVECDDKKLEIIINQGYETIKPLYDFIFGIMVILEEKDNHLPIFSHSTEKLLEELEFRQENQELIRLTEETGYNAHFVTKRELDEYIDDAKKKTTFIKLFKPNIKEIKVVSKLVKSYKNKEFYSVNDFIDYGDYLIDIELESVGIKKLINLYNSLKHLSSGGILVIDELDSHINDVYLIKLIEYISTYSKGQLIFTTHNVSPMEILKSKKNAIDFMAMNGQLTSWTQVGNYSPSNLYKKGMVQGLPFNIGAESFLEVFSDE